MIEKETGPALSPARFHFQFKNNSLLALFANFFLEKMELFELFCPSIRYFDFKMKKMEVFLMNKKHKKHTKKLKKFNFQAALLYGLTLVILLTDRTLQADQYEMFCQGRGGYIVTHSPPDEN